MKIGISTKNCVPLVLLGLVLACGGSSKGPDTQVDTGGTPKQGCTKDDDCKALQLGPCTLGVCDPRTHECVRRLVPDGTACNDSNVCTDNDQCQGGVCQGTRVSCQQPEDSCQNASCVQGKGCVITNKLDGSQCDDNDPCTVKDTCQAGHCKGQPMSCDDGLDCTADSCEGGQCIHKLIAGNCKIDGKCFQNGAANPDNACEVCDTKYSDKEWKVLKDRTSVGGTAICYKGKVCDPAQNCQGKDCGDNGCGGTCGKCGTHYQCEQGKCVYQAYCGDGTCDAAKNENCESCPDDCNCGDGQVCYQQACCTPSCQGKECGADGCGGTCWKDSGTKECSDKLDCTDDTCDSGKCNHTLQSGHCVIDQQCYNKNQHKTDNDCLVCNTTLDTTGWSNVKDNTLCQDGKGKCIKGACCIPMCEDKECGDDGCGGSCWNGDPSKTCDDGKVCTTDSCNKDGKCNHQVVSGYCDIGDTCYKNGEPNPGNPCQYCLASKDQYHWSTRSDEYKLTNGKVCYQGKPCDHATHCSGKECGDDGCGADCGTCKASYICNANQECQYQASCGNGICDSNENCGSCAQDCKCKSGQVCYNGECCTPKCDGRECGDDQCGGVCGTCDSGEACDQATGKCLGKILWTYGLDAYTPYPPAVGDNGVLYAGTYCAKPTGNKECPDDGPAELIALDPSKGDHPVLWKTNMDSAINGAVAIGKSGWIYFADNKNYVYAYKSNGAPAWQHTSGYDGYYGASVGLSATDVFPVDHDGHAEDLYATDGKDHDIRYFIAGPSNRVTVLLNGAQELFGSWDGRFNWVSISNGKYSDQNSYRYEIGSNNVSGISVATLGFLDPVACMTIGNLYCYAHYTKSPECNFFSGGNYDSRSGMVLDMVPGKNNAAYGYFTASIWTSTSAQNGTYLHRALIEDGHEQDKVLAQVAGSTWKPPTLLADGQVLFSAGDCLYDYKVNGDKATLLWRQCLGGFGVLRWSIGSAAVPGKLNGENVVFFMANIPGMSSRVYAVRTLQTLRKAPWPYQYHDPKNTGYFNGNNGGTPW